MDVVIELLGGRRVGIEVKLDVAFVALGCDGELLVGGDAALVGLEEMCEWVCVGLTAIVVRECSSGCVPICRRCCARDRWLVVCRARA